MVEASPGAVTRWRQAYEKRGDDALCAKPQSGRPAKLSSKQRLKLARLLKKGARKHGYPTELWTLKRVAEVIRKHFDVRYDPSGVWHVLRGMGWSCQKPERRARERDESAVAHWRAKDWPRIKKRTKKRA
jgi:transposase